jgi:type 1 glutamine amidotransferase
MTYKKISLSVLGLLLALVFVCSMQTVFAQSSADQGKKVKVLVVTGIEYHAWRETAPQIARQLASCPDLDVRLEPDYNILCSDKMFDYDVIFFNFANIANLEPYQETRDDDLAIDNIGKFLQSGKGIILFHLAMGMFEKRTARVMPLLGRYYDRDVPGHDPFQWFDVTITDKEHPITKHIPDFKIEDELYLCLGGDLPIHVLAEATSTVMKKKYPMAHLYKYGNGHTFTTVLGHDTRALRSQEFVTMLRNAALWLGKKPVPTEPAQVVPLGRPLPSGKIYPPDETSNRVRVAQISNTLASNETLLLYLDCGREWDKAATTGESFSVYGANHRFPGAQDSWVNDSPNQEHVAFGHTDRLRISVDTLNPNKKYRIYLSWWDHDASGRVQSVHLRSKDQTRNELVVKESALPDFALKGLPPEIKSFDVPASFVKDGGCDCMLDAVRGPNAVICEIWLVEVK